MGRREELLREEALGWRELNDALDRLTEEQLERPGLLDGDRSARDVMWHIGCWSADCVHALEQIAAGTFTGLTIAGDVENVNREWLELSRGLDVATVRAQWSAARTLMVERFGAVDPLTPAAIERFEEAGALHYRDHLADLRRWCSAPLAEPS